MGMTYSDVVAQKLILPKKNKYTLSDFKKLEDAGHMARVARFICICSAIYHNVPYSRSFDSYVFRVYCGIAQCVQGIIATKFNIY